MARGRPYALTTATAAEPPEAEIRTQLEKILASDLFVNSERLCRFLNWAVDRTLAGQLLQLKEYALGRDVFDRDENYDPRIDSIVRVEARRLRKKLEQYYRTEGSGDPVVIAFRRGSYVPLFTPARRRESLALVPTEGDSAAAQSRTVAVLPFANLSAEPDNGFFCEGIAEEILNELAAVSELRVVARTSAFRFRQGDLDVVEVGKRLGAANLVEGAVRRAGKRIRVSARIVDTFTGSYVWTGTFDRELGDAFALQDEIAEAVARRLVGHTTGGGPGPRPAAPLNVRAYSAYLQGRHAGSELTVAGWRSAAGHFSRAVALAPGYAQAYAGLSEALNWLVYYGVGDAAELGPRSREAALKALRLDPACADAYVALGSVTSCLDWEWKNGETLLKRGRQLQPGSIAPYLQLGFYYAQTGDSAAAIAASARVLDLDPLSVRAHRNLAYQHYYARDYPAAMALFQRALELSPEVRHTYFGIGEVLLRTGRAEEAVDAFRKAQLDEPNPMRLGGLAEALGAAGYADQAAGAIAQIRALDLPPGRIAPGLIYAFAGLGDLDQALDWLAKACDARYTGVMALKLDPRYDPMRTDPRFTAILERMNLL